MSRIPLSHCGTDPTEHGPRSFIGNTDLAGQLNSGDTSLVLGNEIKGQKPLAQTNVAVVQNSSGCNRGLMMAVRTLVQTV